MEPWLPERVKTVMRALLDQEAETLPSLRKEVAERAAQPAGAPRGSLSASLASYVDRVAHCAFKITDEELAKLRAEGHSEDVIFEVTLAAALGAGLKRLRKGLSLLRGSAA